MSTADTLAFSLLSQRTCPVSSLPVTCMPEWKDIRVDQDYTVSFFLLGSRILGAIPSGIPTPQGITGLLKARNRVLEQTNLIREQHVEIRDFGNVRGKPSREARMMLANQLLKDLAEGYLIGFWVANAPFYIRWMYQVGYLLHKPGVPVSAVKTFEEAIRNAVHELGKNGIHLDQNTLKTDSKDPVSSLGTGNGVCSEPSEGSVRAMSFMEEKIQEYVDDIMRYIGTINWDRPGVLPNEIAEDHPFSLVFDALALIKSDLDDVLEQKQKYQLELERNRRDLEEKVNDRTRELTHANDDLKRAKICAEAANAAKSEFLAKMSHEIRTPLSGIIGMAELCLQSSPSEEQKELLQTLNGEAKSLFGIINSVLDFSKIEAGKLELEEIPFNLRNTFEDIRQSFEHSAGKKGLELVSNLAPEVPWQLLGDPGRLRQILRNLLENAVKFTQRGRILLKGELAQELDEAVVIRFLVIDTGIGIPREKQTTVFESFTQADNSTTRKYGGTGLGITIARQLAEIMGGAMGLESEEGKGSTFYFTARFRKNRNPASGLCKDGDGINGYLTKPIEKEDLKRTIIAVLGAERRDGTEGGRELVTRHTVAEQDRKRARILLAEDYPTNQQVALRYLKNAGYRVEIAENGLEAVTAFKKRQYDLILMDVQMPEMDGYEATEAIRNLEMEISIQGHKQGSKGRVPIIAMTAHAMTGSYERCLKAGMDDYISKPFGSEELFLKVEKWLGRQRERMHVSNRSRQEAAPEEISYCISNDPPMDFDKAVNEFDGDREGVLEITRGFLLNVSAQVRIIREAIGKGNGDAVRKEAHSIRGGASNLYAGRMAELARELENLGKWGGLNPQAEEVLNRLEEESGRLGDYIVKKFGGGPIGPEECHEESGR